MLATRMRARQVGEALRVERCFACGRKSCILRHLSWKKRVRLEIQGPSALPAWRGQQAPVPSLMQSRDLSRRLLSPGEAS